MRPPPILGSAVNPVYGYARESARKDRIACKQSICVYERMCAHNISFARTRRSLADRQYSNVTLPAIGAGTQRRVEKEKLKRNKERGRERGR